MFTSMSNNSNEFSMISMNSNFPEITDTFDENSFFEEIYNETIQEAVAHFSRKFFRKREDDDRYFFNKKDVAKVVQLLNLKGIQVKVDCIYNEDSSHSIFCYVIKPFAIEKEIRTRKNKEGK